MWTITLLLSVLATSAAKTDESNTYSQFLRSGAGARTGTSGTSSGGRALTTVAGFTLYENKGLSGPTVMNTVTDKTLEECALACLNHAACESFVYGRVDFPSRTGWCSGKGVNTPATLGYSEAFDAFVANAANIVAAVDFGRNDQDVESGFTGFSTVGNNGYGYDSNAQSFTGGTWRLTATALLPSYTRNYGDIPTTPLGDLLQDSFVFIHSPENEYVELTLDGLGEGTYRLATYHHSFRSGGGTADASGALEGDSLVPIGPVTSTYGTDITTFKTLVVNFTTTALQNGYRLQFDPSTATALTHFDIAGFKLEKFA
jgi:hypothetical protein